MATLNIRYTEEQQKMLKEIADKDNRSITKEIIQVIENRYKILKGDK